MEKKVRVIQESIPVPAGEFAEWVDEIADLIDNEVLNERLSNNNETIKVESVVVIYGAEKFQFPPAHSGEEFRGFVKRLELFSRLK